MLLLPGAIIALIGAHLYLVVKLGTTAPPWVRAESKPKSLRTETVVGAGPTNGAGIRDRRGSGGRRQRDRGR